MFAGKVGEEVFCQHYHSQGFAGALRMPDHAGLPVALGVGDVDLPQNFFDREILLITGDLFDVFVKEGEKPNQ